MKRVLRKIFGWGIIGFILGLAFAPQKGEETRKQIKEAIEKGKEKFEEIKGNKNCCKEEEKK
ncbi:hypothetical protein A2230_04275 [candidate division WOR-1 bacterium RIFOXYA2_FULL_36_21]|uniref:YtxH domain-containing protein n=1 Tax=candidate division WOR-1 bacterium RIFOXYB2_FULL_36_35 TaxID=1802578 RepID=A0A1F4RYB3_UNCSA|nr:MAG: hypothetical protein A2230_04275 [candidate division WOR-1 bacterium RIFOXYA2_FULL_36_21]OGC13161.1 MAG: hypothetical protein A2290_07620 [candidate division WOR-1 bacterium RIFOXYB2_FULL_36_35]OGC18595.1 MAG: hypothetical protein A2282_04545 [candidate division WOR-1 bacterium RIFOXYA12_FULL_36_13]